MVERIRALLEARQLTPTQFADAIGIARPIVSHILSGRNKPSLEVVQRILAAMPDLSMPWLLNGTGTMLGTAMSTSALPAPTAPIPAAPQVASDIAAPNAALWPDRPASLPLPFDRKATPIPAKPAPKPVETRKPINSPQIKRFTPGNQRPAAVAAVKAEPEALPQPETTRPLSSPTPDMLLPTEPAPLQEVAEPASSVAAAEETSAGGSVASALFAGTEKPIRRIVIFYRDGSFADYQPE